MQRSYPKLVLAGTIQFTAALHVWFSLSYSYCYIITVFALNFNPQKFDNTVNIQNFTIENIYLLCVLFF